MNIQDSVILITGANRGLGKALVEAFVNAGAGKIYAAARDINSLPNFGGTVFAVAMDVTDEASINTALKSTQDVTALINNAGVLSFGDVFSSPLQQWQQTFDVNTYGTLRLTQKFSPVIEQNGGGQIINILTLLSLASMPGMAAYNASKAAAWSINLSLRASLAGKGIAIYGVFPGAIDTDMLAEVDMPKTSPSDVAQAVVNGVIEGNEDIFPDPMSKDVYAAWTQDHKAVEKQFAQM